MSSKNYNFQAGLLMTALIGAAFVIHHQQEANYLAGGSYSLQEDGQGGSGSANSRILTGKISSGLKTPGHDLHQ